MLNVTSHWHYETKVTTGSTYNVTTYREDAANLTRADVIDRLATIADILLATVSNSQSANVADSQSSETTVHYEIMLNGSRSVVTTRRTQVVTKRSDTFDVAWQWQNSTAYQYLTETIKHGAGKGTVDPVYVMTPTGESYISTTNATMLSDGVKYAAKLEWDDSLTWTDNLVRVANLSRGGGDYLETHDDGHVYGVRRARGDFDIAPNTSVYDIVTLLAVACNSTILYEPVDTHAIIHDRVRAHDVTLRWPQLTHLVDYNHIKRLHLYSNTVNYTLQLSRRIGRTLIYLKVGDKIKRLFANRFVNLARLRILRLENNEIGSLDRGVFRGLTSLRVLFLARNHIEKLHRAFEHLIQLRTLHLQSNRLFNLNRTTFLGLAMLSRLNISRSAVIAIERGTFDPLIRLRSLDLRLNTIVGFSESVFSKVVKRLLYLNMAVNNVGCDCSVAWLKKLSGRTRKMVIERKYSYYDQSQSDYVSSSFMCQHPVTDKEMWVQCALTHMKVDCSDKDTRVFQKCHDVNTVIS